MTIDYIPAISISRPWTELILFAGKSVENRVWATHYRGPLILHNAKSEDWARTYAFLERFRDADGELPSRIQDAIDRDHPTGFVGVISLVGDHAANTEDLTECPWGWEGVWHKELSEPRPFDRVIEGRGHQKLFRPPDEVQQHALERLALPPISETPTRRPNDLGFLF